MRRRGLSAVLAALCCSLLLPPGAAAESLAGTVTGADTHAGIAGVWVCASGHPFPPERCANAGVDGRYKIEGLQAGGYDVRFDATLDNYVEQSRPVSISAGQDLTGFDAELQVGGRIAGRVTDLESGEPIERMEVCAPRTDDPAEIRTIYCDRTDWQGNYLIQALASGLYKVEFGTWPSGLDQLNYIRQYFPGRSRWDEAEARPLAAGSTLSGIDAAMRRGVEIAGTVTESGGAPVAWQSRVCALDAGSEAIVQCALPQQGGAYRIAGLPFGSYRVSFGVDVEDEPGLVLHPDGFVPQYYNGKPIFAAADVLGSGGPTVFSGIDARLARGEDPGGPLPPPQPTFTPPAWQPPAAHPKPRLRCRKGFRKRRLKGKRRCVRVHRHGLRRRHHRKHGAAGAKHR